MLDEFLNFFRSFDEEGYDKKGFNRRGFNREGMHRNGTPYDRNGFDVQGYDASGFDREGYDCDGYGSNGFDRDGFNREGYNRDGYDRDGYDCDGFDSGGYGSDGFNRSGFDRDGYDREGYDIEGFDHKGFDARGYDREGFDSCGFSRKGVQRSTGMMWWRTRAGNVPSRLLEEETKPVLNVSAFSLVTSNPIGLLGFTNRPQAKAIQKRAKEIERFSQIGIEEEFENANPYCRVRYDPMAVKEAAEILSNPKKAKEADFFWIDFDARDALENRAADRLANRQLHAACYEILKTRNNKRLAFLTVLLALEQEESCEAAKEVAKCWVDLSADASLFGKYELDRDYVAEKIAALLSDIAERKNDWDMASAFCKAAGKYTNRYFDACIAPVIKTVQYASNQVNEAVKAIEDAKTRSKMSSGAMNKLKLAVDRGEAIIKNAKVNDKIPKRCDPLSEAVNAFAQSVRNAAIAVINSSDDFGDAGIRFSRKMLKTAEKHANSAALQHRIAQDKVDLNHLADDMKYVKERDNCLNNAVDAINREDFSTALNSLRRARSMVRSLEETSQIDQLIKMARKGALAKDFEKQMNAGQLRAALNTIDEAIILEDNWADRLQLCQARDQLASRIELMEGMFRGRF